MGGACIRPPIDIAVPIGTSPEQFEKYSLTNLLLCVEELDRVRQEDDLRWERIKGKAGVPFTRRTAAAYMVEFVSLTTGVVKEVAVEDVPKEISQCLELCQTWVREERTSSKTKRVVPEINKMHRRRVAALCYQHRALLEQSEVELRDELEFELLQNQLLLPLPYSHVTFLVKLFDVININRTGVLSEGEVTGWVRDRWPFVARSIFFPMFLELVDTDRHRELRVNEWVVSFDLYCTLEEFTLVELLFTFVARWKDSHGERVIDTSKLKEEFPVLAEDVTVTGEDVNRPMLAVFKGHYDKRIKIFSAKESPLVSLSDFKRLHQSTQQMLYPMFFLQRGLREVAMGDRFWSKRTAALAEKILDEGVSKRSMEKRSATLRELPIAASVAYIPIADESREEEVDVERTEVLTYSNWDNLERGKAIDLKHLTGKAAAFTGGTAEVTGKHQRRVMRRNQVSEVRTTHDSVVTDRTARSSHTPISMKLANRHRKDPVKRYFDQQHNHETAGTLAPIDADDWVVHTRRRGSKTPMGASKQRRRSASGGAGGANNIASTPIQKRRGSKAGTKRRRSAS